MKERIIGAIVLVVVAILIVPIFLDGPPEEDERVSRQVLLPGQDAEATKTVVLEREREVPMPAPSSAGGAKPQPESKPVASVPTRAAESPVPQTPAPTAEKKPEKKAGAEPRVEPKTEDKPATSSATGMWAVQLGSFSNKDNAENLAASLRKQGYAAFLSRVETANGTMHRVRIGPQKNREDAERMVSRLDRVGHKGRAVPHP